MKNLVMLLMVVLLLVLASAAQAALPQIVIYRYQGKDIKSLPANLILDPNTNLSPWVPDDAKWPSGKRIALLVHGFPMFNPGQCRKDLITLAMHLSYPKKSNNFTLPAYDVIYTVEYPEKFHIADTALVLADLVHARCADWAKNQKFDLFAHSMGGLVARTAIEAPQDWLKTKTISDRVAHLIMMGTPNNGFTPEEITLFKIKYKGFPEADDMLSPPVNGWLNFVNEKKPKVDCNYYMIVGTCSWEPKLFMRGIKSLADKIEGVHDGLVDTDSAGYDLSKFCRSYQQKSLSLNHDYVKSGPELDVKCAYANQKVFSVIDQWMIDDHWFGNLPILSPPIAKHTGLPILLGKNAAEVIALMKNSNWMSDGTELGPVGVNQLTYVYPPNRNYCYCMHIGFFDFDKQQQQYKVYEKNDLVCDVELMAEWMSYDHPENHHLLSVKDIIPSEVLSQKPFGIYCQPGLKYNVITVLWYINHQTYIADITDSRPLFNVVVGKNKNKCFLNKNGQDFKNSPYLLNFMSVYRQIDPKVCPDNYSAFSSWYYSMSMWNFAAGFAFAPFN